MSTDIMDAVAKAIDDKLDWYDISPNAINEAADAALSVARPLIEAEARERALREAIRICMPTDRSLYDSEMRAYGDHFAGMIYALLPAPATEPAAPDGWFKWEGGECPVAAETDVVVKGNNGYWAAGSARHFRWDRHVGHTDIIAYRIVEAGNEGK